MSSCPPHSAFTIEWKARSRSLEYAICITTGDSGDIPVTDIRDFAAQLRSHYSGLSVDVHVFEGENHYLRIARGVQSWSALDLSKRQRVGI